MGAGGDAGLLPTERTSEITPGVEPVLDPPASLGAGVDRLASGTPPEIKPDDGGAPIAVLAGGETEVAESGLEPTLLEDLDRFGDVEKIGEEIGAKPLVDRSPSKPEPVRWSPPTDDSADAMEDEFAVPFPFEP